jgi:spore coat polysaccharide biosynthesis predicted glycosyltransferase SpsG
MDRLLVTLGGSDPAGLTAPVVRALAHSSPPIRADIVLGPGFVGAEEIRAIAATAGAQIIVHEAVPSLAEMMRRADLAIAAGGRTAYELAATGTPAILIASHPAEAPVVRAFERLGTCLAMPDADADADPGAMAAYLQAALRSLSADVERRARMSRMGQAAVDGRGRDRVAAALAELLDKHRSGGAHAGVLPRTGTD